MVITVSVGLAVAMISVAQNAHSLWLANLGFAVAYLFILAALVWALGAWLTSEFLEAKADAEYWNKQSPRVYRKWKRSVTFGIIGLAAIAILVTALFHRDKIVSLSNAPTNNLRKTPRPLMTLLISPSAFPVSVPPRSTLYILPIHPFQTFMDGASLHEYVNSCAVDRPWPSQEEIDSKPANSYEEVRNIEITNHGSDTMESGRIAFDVLYNESFAGGCMAPPKSLAPAQRDVISIPTLDQGETFQFVAMNQTAGCAWLLPPETITVKMANDDGTPMCR